MDVRIQETDKIIRMLNKSKKDLMYDIEEKAKQFPGNVLGAPRICLDNKNIQPNNGSFSLRDRLKDPINLK